jgi:ankyrin repeat protein
VYEAIGNAALNTLQSYVPIPSSLKTVIDSAQNAGNYFVRRLIEVGMDINAFCDTGKTVIHLAVCWGSITMIELLAELGADLDILDESRDSTPLMMTVTGRDVRTTQVLIKSGANVNARNRYGHTALFIAEKDPDTPPLIIQILLKAGATY